MRSDEADVDDGDADDGGASGRRSKLRFHWSETVERLDALRRRTSLTIAHGRVAFVGVDDGRSVTFRPPPLLPIGDDVRNASDYAASFPQRLGRQLVVLFRAGAFAVGLWSDDDCLHHKVEKAYVVRGNGRAQPTHRKTKGKSRAGARLRLRNARGLLIELHDRIDGWLAATGPVDHRVRACPVRLWADLRAERPDGAVFGGAAANAWRTVPWHVPEVTFDELCRVRERLVHGVIESTESPEVRA